MKNKTTNHAPASASDIDTNAIYQITENPETPPEVKKYLLDYVFEKTGVSVEFPETEQIRTDSINLTVVQAVELSKQIITQSHGFYSQDAEDDKPKQAFLILLTALTYEEDRTKRENICLEVGKAVFDSSYAGDLAADQFVKDGYRSLSQKPFAVAGCEKQPPEETVSSGEPLKDLAVQLSEVMKNPNLPTDLYNILSDELATVHTAADAPENILLNLEAKRGEK